MSLLDCKIQCMFYHIRQIKEGDLHIREAFLIENNLSKCVQNHFHSVNTILLHLSIPVLNKIEKSYLSTDNKPQTKIGSMYFLLGNGVCHIN